MKAENTPTLGERVVQHTQSVHLSRNGWTLRGPTRGQGRKVKILDNSDRSSFSYMTVLGDLEANWKHFSKSTAGDLDVDQCHFIF